MVRSFELNPKRMNNRKNMHEYMDELFGFEDELDAVNLDALNDSLSEVTDPTELIVTPSAVREICGNDYAYTLLLVLGRAAEGNPNIEIRFRKESES